MNNFTVISPSSSMTPQNSSTQIPSPISQTSPKISATKPSLLSDKNLYLLCKTYGGHALLWRQKFIGLLPEVFKRKLFEKKGFSSIFEFAKKLAGLSEEQVRRVLNLEEKFQSLPILQNLLINGEVSVNKLARVASIARSENQEFLASQIKILSKSAVETLVRDEKIATKKIDEELDSPKNENGLPSIFFRAKSVPGHTLKSVNNGLSSMTKNSLIFSTEVHQKLLELQQKGLDVNQLILEFLQKRELEIAQSKEQVRDKVLQKEEKIDTKVAIIQGFSLEPLSPQTRHIPQSVKKIIREEFGTKCSVKHCNKSSTEIHHILPFAIGKTHDPKFLVPLCKEHHELQHAVNYQYGKIKQHHLFSNLHQSHRPQHRQNYRHVQHIN